MSSISASSGQNVYTSPTPTPPPSSLDRLSEEESLRIFLAEVDLWLNEMEKCIAALETRHKKNLSMGVTDAKEDEANSKRWGTLP